MHNCYDLFIQKLLRSQHPHLPHPDLSACNEGAETSSLCRHLSIVENMKEVALKRQKWSMEDIYECYGDMEHPATNVRNAVAVVNHSWVRRAATRNA